MLGGRKSRPLRSRRRGSSSLGRSVPVPAGCVPAHDRSHRGHVLDLLAKNAMSDPLSRSQSDRNSRVVDLAKATSSLPPTWISGYSAGGGSRILSKRRMYSATTATSVPWARNGSAPPGGRTARRRFWSAPAFAAGSPGLPGVAGGRDRPARIGHIVVQIGGPLCGCGNRGCFGPRQANSHRAEPPRGGSSRPPDGARRTSRGRPERHPEQHASPSPRAGRRARVGGTRLRGGGPRLRLSERPPPDRSRGDRPRRRLARGLQQLRHADRREDRRRRSTPAAPARSAASSLPPWATTRWCSVPSRWP